MSDAKSQLQSLCVYCGASLGCDPQYAQLAQQFGQLLASKNITLVYGGGRLGLMGVLADAVLAAGGRVIGIIPAALRERELEHQGLTELHIVADMHERKALMAAKADAFVALPGGLGTLEELFEMLTWLQLGLHQKAVGILNMQQFYDGMLAFLAHSSQQGFIRANDLALLQVSTDGATLLQQLADSNAARQR